VGKAVRPVERVAGVLSDGLFAGVKQQLSTVEAVGVTVRFVLVGRRLRLDAGAW
jgi:hypothetical protein